MPAHACRLCAEPLTEPFADLGMTPLSNAYVHPDARDGNRGFAATNNQGIRIAIAEFIVLLTIVTHGWLGRLLRHRVPHRYRLTEEVAQPPSA